MVTDLGHLSLNSIEKLSESQHHENSNNNNNGQVSEAQVLHHNNPSSGGGGSWMWNPSSRHHHQEAPQDEESWEVRAFAEDTGSVMGTTWPPRSYTCTFCRREFRSAQALGGHMNVHRRDRARLHQGSSAPGSLVIPAQELMAAAGGGPAGGGLCFLYQLPPNHNAAMYSAAAPTNNIDTWAAPSGLSHQYNRKSYNKSGESPKSSSIDYSNCKNNGSSSTSGANNMEELDLELRL